MDVFGEPAPDSRESWVVVTLATGAMVATFGTPYAFGVFLSHLGNEYGLSAVSLSAILSLQLFMFYAGAGVIGFFGTRFPARTLVLGCGAVLGALAPALFVVDSYVGLAVVFSLLGSALGVVYVVLAAIVPQWFRERRGVATGVLFSGIGLSLFLLPPAWQFAFDRYGVPSGFLLVLAVVAVVCGAAGLVCRRPPWTERTSVTVSELLEWSATLFRARAFQLHFVGLGLALGWYFLLAAYSIELFTDRGFDGGHASVVFGLIGGISILSRIGSGVVADRIGYGRTFRAALVLVLVANVVLIVPSAPLVYVAVFLFGIGFGTIATLYIPLLLQTYDPEKSVAIVGLFNVSFGVFALGLPPLGTALIASTGSFLPAMGLTLLTSLGALLCFSRA